MTGACPECQGEQMVGHPAGALELKHTNQCGLREAEDSRRVADRSRAFPLSLRPIGLGQFAEISFVRPATPTERILLAAVGFEVPAGEVNTHCEFATAGVRLRSWPDLALADVPVVIP